MEEGILRESPMDKQELTRQERGEEGRHREKEVHLERSWGRGWGCAGEPE